MLVSRLIVTLVVVLAPFFQTGCGAKGGEQGVDIPADGSAALDVGTGNNGFDGPAAPRNSTGFNAGTAQPGGNDGLGLTASDSTDNSGTGTRTGSTSSGGNLTDMPLMNQRTEGGSYPGAYCGPTATRMVLAHYGIQTTPDEVALTNFGSGAMYRPGAGSTHEGMAAALRHYGLNANLKYGKSIEDLRAATAAGHPVICNLRGNYGPFYTNGHIVVVVGVTDEGIVINDSAGGVQRTIPMRTWLNCWQGLQIETWKQGV